MYYVVDTTARTGNHGTEVMAVLTAYEQTTKSVLLPISTILQGLKANVYQESNVSPENSQSSIKL